jgi:serine phosphatase RsbU (regulator of sigma subunit)
MASQYVSANGSTGHEPHPWPVRIEPGDTLVIYTDGLVEARRGKEEYGMKRLRETVAELGGRPAVEMAAGIVASVNGFTGGGVRRDDLTVVVVKRTVISP